MYTLSEIVNESLIEMGYTQSNRYAQFYQFAVSGLREFNMDMGAVPKVASLTINSNDTVDLPNDYVNYSRVAICGKDGFLHSLGQNNNLCLNRNYDDCGNPVSHTSVSEIVPIWNGWYWDNNIRNGEVMGRFFGIGGGNNANGYYRFDLEHGQILLSGTPALTDSIILEYIADINAVDDDYLVHPFIVDTLKNWIYWKSIARDRNRSANEKEMAMIDYQRSERISRIRFNSRTDAGS